jgi:hypothetical protein
MKLVRFEDINGRETFVNPDRVNHVSDYGSGTTEINFGSGINSPEDREDGLSLWTAAKVADF